MKLTEDTHSAIDKALVSLFKKCKGKKQFVKGHLVRGGYLVGRYTPVKGERYPRLLEGEVIKF